MHSTQHLTPAISTTPRLFIAQLRDKQPLALQIDAEVIDAAAHLTKRDLRLEYEW